MPLNKLENFIKNTDGRTLYVNPADLNATDSITNQGTSLTEPFRTIQRALIEAARFSYIRGNDNDLIEKTTIVIYPGEHPIDNRPGYGIKLLSDNPVAVKPDGSVVDPFFAFNLKEDSNFDIESPDNILHRFNSIYGGVIVPRGTSIVGMDLRKTKIRPLYVPNPTDPAVPDSAIFRITGTCYFWQFTIFDGEETGVVFTDNKDFSENNRSVPTFSHHKLTAFEYADGVNPAISNGFEQTDLSMYYSKLSNAYNEASTRPIDEKFPFDSEGFAPQRPEFEIVGAFATDPVNITRIISGDGFTPDAVVTVDTATPHGLSVGTPIKIRGVAISDYNISTKVANILGPQRFTYALSFVRPNLPAEPSVSSATVTVETDTVTGASPYIFNCSMRSVWGINGMHADGAKATGFRSMVVAQFTAISLQKDDRAFVKYNQPARRYDGINYPVVRGAELSAQSSSTNSSQVYHLDPQAIYRPGWDTTHIKMSNDAVIQIVSVFAIGFNQHFGAIAGADASITNSNSNFGQFALLSDGFKNDAFDKDDQGFITSIITPRNAFNQENDKIESIDYVNIDFDLTRQVASNNQLYLLGYTNSEELPPAVTQGFRIGANYDETLILPTSGDFEVTAKIQMVDNVIDATNNISVGSSIARKVYNVLSGPINNVLTLPAHGLLQGEKIRIFSATGDLPENVEKATLYYCNVVDAENIRLSTSEANAFNDIFINIYGGSELRIESRVNDKNAGDPGHPLQFDAINQNWFIHTESNSGIYDYLANGDGRPGRPGELDGQDFVTTFDRKSDNRNLDDKLYRLRYVIPKESTNAKPPTPGYVIQTSSTTGVRNNDDLIIDNIGISDYDYQRNTRFIVNCQQVQNRVEVRTERPHQLSVGDKIKIINVTSTNNPDGTAVRGFNGEFEVVRVRDARNFDYSITDVSGFTRIPGTFTNDTNDRNILLPRFVRKDNKINAFVYRIEEITPFVEGIRDGIYHLFCVNGGNKVDETFTDRAYNQPIEDLYPQLDTDNLRQNPPASTTFAARAPLGRTFIDEPQNSITRETIDRIYKSGNRGTIVDSTTLLDLGNGTQRLLVELDREHSFNGVYSYTSLNGGSGYPQDGVFHNIALVSNSGSYPKGAAATVTITSGSVSDITITDPGSGYLAGETLTISTVDLPGGNASILITENDIEINRDTILQFTGGGGTAPDFYALLDNVVGDNSAQFTAICPVGATVTPGMYVYPSDSSTEVGTYTYVASDLESTFTAANNSGIGLQRGNSFVAFDSQRRFLGQYYVKGQPQPTVMDAITGAELTDVKYIGRCGLEDNDASTGSVGENIGVRGTELFGLGTFYLEDVAKSADTEIRVRAKDGGVAGSVADKLYIGRYIKIGNEIMRISSKNVSGPQQNIISVIRGALGTNVARHETNSKVRAIEPQAIELRRPSILRASGHTFEYLGYGPGNYSTSLPQLQVRQLPDDEVYLVQSQELSCGQVVYTGMSDNGDFYIGNTKYSATSGTQTTFDIPVPTVAGQAASSNSVVFDEVIINRRLFVAGGETNEVLSQFDGPVKFTQSVTIQDRLSVTDTSSLFTTIINDTQNSTAPSNGAITVRGGAGILKDLYVGGTINVTDLVVEDTLDVGGDVTIGGDTYIAKDLDVGGDIILDNTSTFIYSNNYRAVNGNVTMTLFDNQGSGEIQIGAGGTDKDVRFRSTKPGTGIGGVEGIAASSAGVEIDGGLVVRDTIIAKEFRGDGLGAGPGSIVMWGGNIASPPRNYLVCNGALVNRNTYSKLFAVIGYTYGGSGNNFRLPDLRNRFVVGTGNQYGLGAKGGANTVTLTLPQLATHKHGTEPQSTSHAHPGSTASTTPSTVPHGHTSSITGNQGQHTHSSVQAGGGDHPHSSATTGAGGLHGHTASTPASSGPHSHPGATVPEGGSHDHPFAKTPNTGGEHSHTTKRYNSLRDAAEGAQSEYWFNAKDVTITGGGHGHDVSVPDSGSGHDHTASVPSAGSTHSHPATVTPNTGSHNHPVTVPSTSSGHSHNVTTPDGSSGHNHTSSVTPSTEGTHNHPASVSVAPVTQSHIHKIDPAGGGQAHENRPPYFALAYIIQFK